MRVLKVFTSKTCGPCKVMKPLLAGLNITVVEIDVEDHPELAARNLVRGVPTLKLFDNNDLLRTSVGGMSKLQLAAFVK